MRILSFMIMLFVTLGSSILTVAQTDANAVQRVDMNADGTRFAAATSSGLALYDSEFNLIQFREYTAGVNYRYIIPSFSPDGSYIRVGNEIWDSATLEIISVLPMDDSTDFQWSPDSRQVLIWVRGTEIYDVQSGRLLHEVRYWRRWGPDADTLLEITNDTIFIRDRQTDELIESYVFPGQTVGVPIWDRDRLRFAVQAVQWVSLGTPNSYPTGSGSPAFIPSLFIVNTQTRSVLNLQEVPSQLRVVTWDPAGEYLIGGTTQSTLHIWNTMDGEVVGTHALPSDKLIDRLAYTNMGGRLFIGFSNRSLPLSSTETAMQTASLFGETALGGAVQVLIPDPSPERLAAIAEACDAPPSVMDAITTVNTVSLSADTSSEDTALVSLDSALDAALDIPPACAADLHAVADALAGE